MRKTNTIRSHIVSIVLQMWLDGTRELIPHKALLNLHLYNGSWYRIAPDVKNKYLEKNSLLEDKLALWCPALAEEE